MTRLSPLETPALCLLGVRRLQASDAALVIASNRDEYHARPTAPLHVWQRGDGKAAMAAGKDLKAGGTWLGFADTGRWAALTNLPASPAALGAPSRGAWVEAWLDSPGDAQAFAARLLDQSDRYSPFNLVFGQGRDFWCYCAKTKALAGFVDGAKSGEEAPESGMAKGGMGASRGVAAKGGEHASEGGDIFTLANGLPGEGCPRSSWLQGALAETPPDLEELRRLLRSRRQRMDRADPPDAPFLVSPAYGTRATTCAVLRTDGWEISETSYLPDARAGEIRRLSLPVLPTPEIPPQA